MNLAASSKRTAEKSDQTATSSQQAVASKRQKTTSDEQTVTNEPEVGIINDPSGIPIIGTLKPTETFLQRVTAATSMVCRVVHVENKETYNAFLVKELPGCEELLIKVAEEYLNSYHPKIFPVNADHLLPLFDYRRMNYNWNPKVVVYQQGILNLQKYTLTILMPLYRRGDIVIEAKALDGNSVVIDWYIGSVIIVPARANLHMSGDGQLVFFHTAWANMMFEDQR